MFIFSINKNTPHQNPEMLTPYSAEIYVFMFFLHRLTRAAAVATVVDSKQVQLASASLSTTSPTAGEEIAIAFL